MCGGGKAGRSGGRLFYGSRNQPLLLPFPLSPPPLSRPGAAAALSFAVFPRWQVSVRRAGSTGFAPHPPCLLGRWRRPAGEAASAHSNGSAVSRGTRADSRRRRRRPPSSPGASSFTPSGCLPLPLSPVPCPASAEGNPAEGRGAGLQAPGNFPSRLMGGGDGAEERSWGREGGRGKGWKGGGEGRWCPVSDPGSPER